MPLADGTRSVPDTWESNRSFLPGTTATEMSWGGNAVDKSRDRYTGWALAVVLALGVGVRWYYVADRSIWFDEAFSWRMIQYPFGEMFRRMALDNAPPLYYLLLKSWCACFGDSLPALRSLSVVMGGVTILAMFLFVRAATASLARADIERRANDRRGSEAALFAAMFVALSVFQIRWSWDARPYALGAALALLSSWALFRALWAGEQPPGATCSTRAGRHSRATRRCSPRSAPLAACPPVVSPHGQQAARGTLAVVVCLCGLGGALRLHALLRPVCPRRAGGLCLVRTHAEGWVERA